MARITEARSTPRRSVIVKSIIFIFAAFTLGILVYSHKRGALESRPDHQKVLDYGPLIGIDVGHSYTRAAFARNGKIEMVIDEHGRSNIPSWGSTWSFSHEPRVADYAPPENTSARTERWTKKSVQRLLTGLKLNYRPEKSLEWPPEAHTLKYIKSLASKQLGRQVTHAVLTIPANSNDTMRQALRDAASLAGLTALRVVDTPVAAAIAHGVDTNTEVYGTEAVFAVVDVGASELGVSLISVDDGVFEVLGDMKDSSLGGDAYNSRVLDWLIKRMEQAGRTVDRAQLLNKTETIKYAVSSHSVIGGDDGEAIPSREEFTKVTLDLVEGLSAFIDEALALAETNKTKVDMVILTGGTSKLPQIRSMIQAYFGKAPLTLEDGEPEEAAARGAAVKGAIINGESPFWDGTECTTWYLAYAPLGIETSGGLFEQMIPRNTNLPTRKWKEFGISKYQMHSTKIRLLLGTRRLARDNRLLAEFELPELEAGSRIKVTLQWGDNDDWSVAVHNSSNLVHHLLSANGTFGLTSKEIEHIYEELDDSEKAQTRRAKDTQVRAANLRKYIVGAQTGLSSESKPHSRRQREQYHDLDKIFDWLSIQGSGLELDNGDEKLGQARAIMDEGLDRMPTLVKAREREEL